ncbi:unnamed protein product [[Candida] boidinii]|uniref:Transaldolase n=1 Tax=Candida boidinii TaxID=5477 RepID=A0A9W6T4X6_CANBO|nr:hypothetical protein BVG19_g1627 [[Candida] boidinii]OWB49930.1 hypothetical protein B5S27_g1475 [[Candida] boidinii]OWB65755.1 hypothetical protein B5S30_g1086 [[Candida] boidinii]GME74808.1 unnamed protein product [[Candida] boidinii]GMG10820.1 unnamed protein product [[Candida] boidinii]
MSSSLDQLKASGTVVVTDTGEFESIAKYKPQDATTNPSLILAAANKPQYAELIDRAVKFAIDSSISNYNNNKSTASKAARSLSSLFNFRNSNRDSEDEVNISEITKLALDRLLVEFGTEILKIVPGRVSTEVDARLSFDKEATIKKALELIQLYEDNGIGRERILIKIAATWEGIQAAKELESRYDIHCNLTLLFSFVQAVACAEAEVTLISPFVGRILDWYKDNTGNDYSDSSKDPGVLSVKRIFQYYKRYGYSTIVMGASFRNTGEIKYLTGCDYLTISPKILEELSNSNEKFEKYLDFAKIQQEEEEIDPKVSFINNESSFRFELNEDQMSTEKLSEGVRKFSKDCTTLSNLIESKIKLSLSRLNKL